MSLSDVANISITAETTGISRVGFGTLAIYANDWPTSLASLYNVLEYTNPSDMITAGWPINHPAYLEVASIFSQPENTGTVKILKSSDATVTKTLKITVLTAVDDKVYQLRVRIPGSADQTIEFDAGSSPTTTTIATGLAAAITALAIPSVTSVGVSADIDVTRTGSLDICVSPVSGQESDFDLKDLTTDPGVAAELSALQQLDPDWYGLVAPSFRGSDQIVAIAAWAEANGKLFCGSTYAHDVPKAGSSDVASLLQTADYGRSFVFWHRDPFVAQSGALMGYMLGFDVGEAQWVYKTLSGVSYLLLSTTERTQLKSKNVTYMDSAASVASTRGGKVAGGEWIDQIRLIDFFRQRIPEDIYQVQLNNSKIPFTIKGIRVIVSTVQGRLDSRIERGLSADPAPLAEGPTIAQTTSSDRIDRHLRTVTFTATLEGAIILTTIRGNLTV